MKKVIFLLVALSLLPWKTRAQETSPRSFTLQEAITFALEHNKQLQASAMNIELYKQKVRETIAQGLPQVNGSVDYSTNFNHEMDFGGMKITMKDQSNAKLSLQQLLFNGQWLVGVRASRLAHRLAAQQIDITEQEVVENVCNSYYNILACRRMLAILDRNIQLMNDSFEHTRDMFSAGVMEETDVDQLRVSVGQLENSRLSMQRTLEVSHNLLRIQMGIEGDTPVTLSDDLECFIDPDANARLALQPFHVEENLQYRLVATQTEVNKKLLDAEKWSHAPTLAGLYSYTHKILKPELDMSPKHAAGLSLSIPIFSGMQRDAKIKQARVTLEQSLVNKSLLEEQLAMQERQLKFELNNAMENYNLQKENIEVANRVLDSYKRKYEVGTRSSMELTQANTTYLQAENNYTSAVLALLQARLNLEKLYNRLPHVQ
ncbi:MAG: TolC family protein [Odoribacteraceae bacterium]|jgi:outer membrane protein TolC|nr:TolC family protein [Odoribacteraceae bacterium]